MSGWNEILGQLHTMERLLKSQGYRDRLRHCCFRDDPVGDEALQHWHKSLKNLRWHSICDFVSALLPLERTLRARWNVKHMQFKARDAHNHEEAVALWHSIDTVIKSAKFWTYAAMIFNISLIEDYLSHWAEGCSCPGCQGQSAEVGAIVVAEGPPRAARQCRSNLKGCRAPDMAFDHVNRVLLPKLLEHSNYHMVGVIAGARLPPNLASEILADWNAARTRLSLEVKVRTSNWQVLPWRLCAIGHWRLEAARGRPKRITN
jgi:hypothetical protein